MGKLKGSKSKGLLFIILAVVCGLIAAGIIVVLGKQVTPSVPVLMANVEITAGDPIHGSMLKTVNMPSAGLASDAIGSDSSMANTVAAHGMMPGDILRESGIIRLDNEPSLLSARLEALKDSKLRGVEVPVEAAAGMLAGMKAGDRVDILAVRESTEDDGRAIGETIIEKARVVGVQPPDESQGVLIVALTQKEAETFVAARSMNKVYAALCPYGSK